MRRSGYRAAAVFGTGAVVAYLCALAWAMTRVTYDIWGAMVVGPVLIAISVPVLTRAAREDPDPFIGKVLFLAFAAKMVGTLLRYAITFEVYGGRADAGGYHGSGRRLAAAFWNGTWDRVLPDEVPQLVGTEFVRLVTGVVYVVTGPTKLGGFLVFGWLGFWGLFFFFKAFRLAFPEGDHRRYAVLVFFLPTLLYWPSSLGKESWMLFTLGLATYGVAQVLTYRPQGYVIVILGFAGTAAVRPHVTLVAFGALFIAFLLRRRAWTASKLGLLGRLGGLVLVIALGSVVVAQTASFFNIDSLDTTSVDQILDRTVDQSSKGSSEFDAPRLTSPAEYPFAIVSVLFRPFPWEVGNAQALAASAEGAFLIVLSLLSLPRLARVPGLALRVPYLGYALVYSIAFVIAFSAVANFGLLARQRTQVLPLFLVLLAAPAQSRSPRKERSRRQPRVSNTSRALSATSS